MDKEIDNILIQVDDWPKPELEKLRERLDDLITEIESDENR